MYALIPQVIQRTCYLSGKVTRPYSPCDTRTSNIRRTGEFNISFQPLKALKVGLHIGSVLFHSTLTLLPLRGNLHSVCIEMSLILMLLKGYKLTFQTDFVAKYSLVTRVSPRPIGPAAETQVLHGNRPLELDQYRRTKKGHFVLIL